MARAWLNVSFKNNFSRLCVLVNVPVPVPDFVNEPFLPKLPN